MYGKFGHALITCSLLAIGTLPALAGEDYGRHHKKDGYWEYLDTDGDGQVTREEFTEHTEQRFAKMDENGDGVISKDEFEGMRKMHKEKMHKHKKKGMQMQNQEE